MRSFERSEATCEPKPGWNKYGKSPGTFRFGTQVASLRSQGRTYAGCESLFFLLYL
jgi:hypothetical protein